MVTRTDWTVRDLDLFPQPIDDTRYEIIDGVLHVSTQPHLEHQIVWANAAFALRGWDPEMKYGVVSGAPGVIFAPESAVAPDLVWASHDTGAQARGTDGKYHAAPDLMVEILSYGTENERRDRETKLDLYQRWGVKEYWILDRKARSVEVYRREGDQLRLVKLLSERDTIESPSLPGFRCPIAGFFVGIERD